MRETPGEVNPQNPCHLIKLCFRPHACIPGHESDVFGFRNESPMTTELRDFSFPVIITAVALHRSKRTKKNLNRERK